MRRAVMDAESSAKNIDQHPLFGCLLRWDAVQPIKTLVRQADLGLSPECTPRNQL